MLFDLQNAENWDPVVCKGLISCIGKAYPDKLKDNADVFKYADSFDEGYELFSTITSEEKLIVAVTNEMVSFYDQVQVYHACRTNNPDSYHKQGLLPLSIRNAQRQFRELFNDHVPEESIESAIAATPINLREGVVHLAVDDRWVIERTGHYLIYGGEYQKALTSHLPESSIDMRNVLKNTGRGTIFVCQLPFSELNDCNGFIPELIADHFYRIAKDKKEVSLFDYTVTLNVSVPPSAIVDVYYPDRIPDPEEGFKIWNDRDMRYE